MQLFVVCVLLVLCSVQVSDIPVLNDCFVHLCEETENIYNKFCVSVLLVLIGSSSICGCEEREEEMKAPENLRLCQPLTDPSPSVM